ncbi:hypothetical protein ACGFNV_35350 [Streptomyces sp. NPDC048751]|uniref:hypothetical protein n=1 Tax=Streptomyces sp. NPDC048751 TaxID=3365591 RepID=UPI003717C01E
MFSASRSSARRRGLAAAGAAAALALTLAACGSSSDSSSMPGMNHRATSSSPSASQTMGDMPGMDHAATDNGLSDTKDGYRLTSKDATLLSGKQAAYRFSVTGPDGRPVTGFALDQTKRMHLLRHPLRPDRLPAHPPTMAADGTWSADLASLAPGSWRMFASFTPAAGAGKGEDFVLSRTLTVPGNATKAPLPAPAASTQVDGYTVTLKGEPMAGMAHPLTVSIAKDGKPVTDLQSYLDTYAHLTAFHEGDAAFAHLHPTTEVTGDRGGPDLNFHAELPASGNWRLFLQFQTGGTLHTAALTLRVG